MEKGNGSTMMLRIFNLKVLGNVVDDVHHLVCGMHWVNFSCIRRGGNRVANALAQHARNISEDVFWMENSPPPALNALYRDSHLL